MSFWQLAGDAEASALLLGDPVRPRSYGELRAACDELTAAFGARARKRLGFVLCRNDEASLVAYLAALRAGDCAALLPERIDPAALQDLIARYRPDWLFAPATHESLKGRSTHRIGDHALALLAGGDTVPHADLALLLSTSGSTGSPRMVRLSYANLDANAASIAQYLELTAAERPITTLPMHYSYGLSVINSHLHAGAAVVLTDDPVTARPFWDLFQAAGVTSLAGVPFTWQMLARLRFERMALPTLRTLTQAGGRLSPELIEHFRQLAAAHGWRFFVMYGQTEATARIAFVPPMQLAEKCGAIGYAIPGGTLSLGSDGELNFAGPNVMMGYAECREDLSKPDTMQGRLATGDLARVDSDGCYWLTGRIKRIAKLFGNRVNLDEIEAMLESYFACPAAALDEDDALRIACTDATQVDAMRDYLRSRLGVHASGIRISTLAALPLTASGKKDYPALRAQLAASEAQGA